MDTTTTMFRPRALAADAAGFEAYLAAHRGIVRKVAASYAADADDRADLAQEIALQLWRAWPTYSPERSFSTWMYRIALNVAISHRRRERGKPGHDALDERHADLVGDADVDAETRQRLALVRLAMQSLGRSETNVATRLNRIRQQLRRDVGA